MREVSTEYAACEILNTERVLNARLWMLISTLYQKIESAQWYKRSCASSYMVVATMNLRAVEPYT